MFENHNNSQTNTKETIYIPVNDDTVMQDKNKKNSFSNILKAICAVCCVAAISAGSITGYRCFSDRGYETDDSTALIQNNDSEANEKSELSAYNVSSTDMNYQSTSLLQLSKSEDVLSTQEIYKKVLPSVVGVSSMFEYQPSSQYGGMFGYNGNSIGGMQTVSGTGTGIVISEDGYIITNAHVIYEAEYGCATEVSILMSDHQEYEAQVVAYDVQTDIAVLKIEATGLTAAEIGDSDSVEVGDEAIAIGNPLGFDLFGTLTVGHISGTDRQMAADDTVMNLIQTDAAINSGNSGGPLINKYGQIIGINSMKISNSYSSSSAAIEGLGFAIPVNSAKEIVDELMTNGYVTGRPQLGITCRNISSGSYQPYSQSTAYYVDGVLIVEVTAGGTAEKSGLQPGDIIVGADKTEISTLEELNKIKNQHNAEDTLTLTIIRENQYYNIDVILEEASAQ